MKRTLGIAGSVLLHLAVLLALLLTPTRHPKPEPKHVGVSLPGERPSRLRGETSGRDGLACGGYHYTGIGLMYSPGGGRIIDVGPDTPAARAGLQPGDVLVDPEQLAPDRFQTGHTVQLRILRDGRELVLPITIERICNED